MKKNDNDSDIKAINSEKYVLGCALEEDCFATIKDSLTIEDFYSPMHKILYKAMDTIYKQAISDIQFSIVTDILDNENNLENAGGIEYLLSLQEVIYDSSLFETHINIIKDMSIKRSIRRELTVLIEENNNQNLSPTNILAKIDTLLTNKLVATKRDMTTLTEVVDEFERITRKNKGKSITGLVTGYNLLDQVINGLNESVMLILAARPGIGKSAFALEIAKNVATLNKNGKASVAFFSLEMSNFQITQRLISNATSIPLSKITSSKLSETDWENIETTKKEFKDYNIYFEDSCFDGVGEIRNKCRKLKKGPNGLDFVVIDYIQLIKGDSKKFSTDNRQVEVADISRSIKQLTRELKIPILCLAQVSRSAEQKSEKKLKLSHLRESGALEQDADIVLLLNDRTEKLAQDADSSNERKYKEIVLDIAKNRQGRTSNILMQFSSNFMHFTESGYYDEINGKLSTENKREE
ncbi:MAG: replicative DNA helicase [Acholeplasmatales bacterium]|jgi:replicative DNA helicase|nr:replicative DNA helicase [Acholeplasmatales bacterium]